VLGGPIISAFQKDTSSAFGKILILSLPDPCWTTSFSSLNILFYLLPIVLQPDFFCYFFIYFIIYLGSTLAFFICFGATALIPSVSKAIFPNLCKLMELALIDSQSMSPLASTLRIVSISNSFRPKFIVIGQ